MTNSSELSTIEYAIRARDGAIKNNEPSFVIQYWNGYIDGAKAQRKEDRDGEG